MNNHVCHNTHDYQTKHPKRYESQSDYGDIEINNLKPQSPDIIDDQAGNTYEIAENPKKLISPQNHQYENHYHYPLPKGLSTDVLRIHVESDHFFLCYPHYCVLGELKEGLHNDPMVCEAGNPFGDCLALPPGVQDPDDPSEHTQGMSNIIGPNNHHYLSGYVYTPPDDFKCDKICVLLRYDHFFICHPDYCVVGEREWDEEKKQYFPEICEAGKKDGECVEYPPES